MSVIVWRTAYQKHLLGALVKIFANIQKFIENYCVNNELSSVKNSSILYKTRLPKVGGKGSVSNIPPRVREIKGKEQA